MTAVVTTSMMTRMAADGDDGEILEGFLQLDLAVNDENVVTGFVRRVDRTPLIQPGRPRGWREVEGRRRAGGRIVAGGAQVGGVSKK